MTGMMDLVNNFPEAPDNFKAAQESVLQGIASERIIKTGILLDYEKAKKLGFDHDIRKDIYTKVPTFAFADIKAFSKST